jgi:hypothetical protein
MHDWFFPENIIMGMRHSGILENTTLWYLFFKNDWDLLKLHQLSFSHDCINSINGF